MLSRGSPALDVLAELNAAQCDVARDRRDDRIAARVHERIAVRGLRRQHDRIVAHGDTVG